MPDRTVGIDMTVFGSIIMVRGPSLFSPKAFLSLILAGWHQSLVKIKKKKETINYGLIILHIRLILWDKVADIIVISNVGNFIPGHNILKYRNQLNITGLCIG